MMKQAGKLLGQWKFRECVLYTTLQPCPMCENALLQAEAPKVVFGGSGFKFAEIRFAKANLTRVGPVLEGECRGLFIRWLRVTGHQVSSMQKVSDCYHLVDWALMCISKSLCYVPDFWCKSEGCETATRQQLNRDILLVYTQKN
jgi:hypothetical protein